MNGLTHLAGSWTTQQKRMNIAKLQHTKPFMPPFAGNTEELEALVQMIEWTNVRRPPQWPVSSGADTFARIRHWLEEAGTSPGRSKLLTNLPVETK
jgi:hypothetical protein